MSGGAPSPEKTEKRSDPTEWKVEQMRALEASARFLFPTGNTGLAARLYRIHCPVLLLRGSVDKVMPGDNVQMTIELIIPIAMDEGLRFAIREGGRTVGAGVVAKILK